MEESWRVTAVAPTLALDELSCVRKDHVVNLTVPGIVLTVTGIIALIVSLTKGPNLGLSRRTGVAIGAVLLVLGCVLLVYTATSP